MQLTVQMTGFDALTLRVKYLKKAASRGLSLGVDEAAGLFETEAKQNSPVLTGANRDSITTEKTIDEAEKQERVVAPHMPYSARLEFGFVGTDSLGRVYNQAARPYMRPAFDTQKADARQAIEDGVLNEVIDATNTVAARRNARVA